MTQINRQRFKYTLSFGHTESVEQPNGTWAPSFVKDFTRKAALYRVTDNLAKVLTGVDTTKDLVFAVNKQYHDELNFTLDTSNLDVQVSSDPGNDYTITQISYSDDQALMDIHLIALRKVVQNNG